MQLKSIALIATLAYAGAVLAQTPAPPAASPPPAAAPAKPAAPKPRSAKSLECSKQADSQSLHGKPRKTFMRTCKKAEVQRRPTGAVSASTACASVTATSSARQR